MKVKLYPADKEGCGWYRIILPGQTVAANSNLDVQICEPDDEEQGLVVHLEGSIQQPRVVSVDDPECDVLVLQRPFLRRLVECIPLIQAHGTAVVVDTDDDFEGLDNKHPAKIGLDPNINPDINVAWFRLATQFADLVTVSTPALARRYGVHGRVRELANFIPKSYLDTKGARVRDVTLGWTGSPRSHPGDLDVVKGPVSQILTNPGVRFRAIGDPKTLDALGCEGDVVEWVPLHDGYMEAVASLDIGIVPLKLSPFNQAKSSIKGLEYAAAGVPFVASPTAPYKQLAKLGGGELADYPSDWARKLGKLVMNDDWRKQRADLGRIAARQLTIDEHWPRFAQAWTDALSIRRSQ